MRANLDYPRDQAKNDYIIELMLLLLTLDMGLKCLDIQRSDNRDWTLHTHMHIGEH